MNEPGQAGQRRRPKRFEFTPETCPNFDFACWLREWYEEAANKDLRIQFAYRKALEAMVRWPEKLRSGKEAERLPGIGPSISGKLSERMMLGGGYGWIGGNEADRIIDLNPEPERPKMSKKTRSVPDPQTSEPKTTAAKARKAASYVPSYRSGPYALLVALLLHLNQLSRDAAVSLFLGKNELQMAAQPLCTASLSEGSGVAFSAISGALKILESKRLIVKNLLPPQYSLTKQGLVLARRLYDAGEQTNRGPLNAANLDQFMSSLPDLESEEIPAEVAALDTASPVIAAAREDAEPKHFTWPAGSFEVTLLVDVREIRSREDRNYLTDRLRQLNVSCELRNLELGDFLWVARRKSTDGSEEGRKGSDVMVTEEIVLDTLIERKREDDLAASILDGRFKEQKHRIRRSLLRSCFYIVERNGASAMGGDTVIGADALLAATMQSMLLDGLMVRQTSSLEDTIAFLAFLHRRLLDKLAHASISSLSSRAVDFTAASYSAAFKSAPDLAGPTYTAYALLCGKSGNLTPTDYYLRQLLTVRGLSMDKALILLRSLPTPKRLHEYFQDRRLGLQEPNASDALASIPSKLGKALMTRLTSIFDDYA